MNEAEALRYFVDTLELVAIPEMCCCDTEMYSDRLICPLCAGEASHSTAKIEDADHDSSCPYVVARDALMKKSYRVAKYYHNYFQYDVETGIARFVAVKMEKVLSKRAGPNTKYYVMEEKK
jgi:hypothetical protein